ncbi:MAG TPA: CAP domain-containing protein, partial [Gaiellaceae bacterium]|nr:CAP domain-containing protein [Gaiellaceae bacterium]
MVRAAAAVAAVIALAVPALSQAAGMSSPEASLLRQMNLVRAQHGLGPLTFDGHLQLAARAHSREMIAAGVFRHGAFASRMARFRIEGSIAGENLAWGTGAYGSARGVVAAWLSSPEHRANLLKPSYRRVGV